MINFERKLDDLRSKTDELGRSAQKIKKMVELLRYQRDFAISKWFQFNPELKTQKIDEFNKIIEETCK